MGSLNQLQVKNAKAGRHGDGDGLYLLVSPTGAKSWVLRVQADGKRRDVGLGAADTTSRVGTDRTAIEEVAILQRKRLTLAEAREKSALLRAVAQSGRDPVAERDKERKKVTAGDTFVVPPGYDFILTSGYDAEAGKGGASDGNRFI